MAAAVSEAQDEITRLLGQPADAAISSARHAACLNLFERVARVTHPRRDWREQVDRLVMHPVWGYAVLVLVFLGIFQLIFTVGKFGEDRILGVFNGLIASMSRHMDPQSVLFAAAKAPCWERQARWPLFCLTCCPSWYASPCLKTWGTSRGWAI